MEGAKRKEKNKSMYLVDEMKRRKRKAGETGGGRRRREKERQADVQGKLMQREGRPLRLDSLQRA